MKCRSPKIKQLYELSYKGTKVKVKLPDGNTIICTYDLLDYYKDKDAVLVDIYNDDGISKYGSKKLLIESDIQSIELA